MALEVINIGTSPDDDTGESLRSGGSKINNNFDDVHYFVNAKEHGAVGNDSTDDSAAIQAAIDAVETAGGGSVFFPLGTYICEGVVIPSNVRLHGTVGAILKHKASSTTFCLQIESAAVDSAIENLTIDGNSPNITSSVVAIQVLGSRHRLAGLKIYDSEVHAIQVKVPADHILIDGCQLYAKNAATASSQGAINLEENVAGQVEDIVVRGCHISDPGQSGVGGRCNGLTVANCSIQDTGTDGVAVYANAVSGTSKRMVVTGNNILNPSNNGTRLGGDGDKAVIGNVYVNCGQRGIYLQNDDPTTANNGVVSGNLVDGTTSNPGIEVATFNNVSITGNTVVGAGTAGINVTSCDNASVTGNTVKSSTTNGIAIVGTTRAVVSGNMSVDNTSRGIQVSSTSDDVLVCNNICDNNTVAQVRVQDSATNVYIRDNLLKGTLPIDESSSGTIIVGRNDGDVATPEMATRRFKSALYYTFDGWGGDGAGSVSTAAEMVAVPMSVGINTTFDRIACQVTNAGASGSVVRLGIYADNGSGYPGSLVLDAGTVVSTSTGGKEITISQLLFPGLYWLVAVAQGAPATEPTIRTRSGGIVSVGQTSITGTDIRSYTETGVTGALPSTFTSTVTVSSTAPKLMLRAV